MACTSQSALEYVTSARPYLMTHLRDLSVIVENLQQEKVFHGDEVSTIQAERNEFEKARKILDSVTKKGEEACYKFLRVIDRTWKRTSGRGSAHSETTTEASSETEKFNLSYWISCFPFREDAENYEGLSAGPRSCQKYQAKLKTQAREKSSEFWTRNKKLLDESYSPDLCYSPLVLVTQGREFASKIKKLKSKKSKMSRPKKLKTYIPVDKPNTSPHELLKTNQNILLVGKPGIGKTALCHEMFKLWAENEIKELDYMFYFDMRQTSDFTERMSLEELLFRVCTEPDEGKEEVVADIKKFSDNVTMVFDGITDLSSSLVKSVVERDLLPNAKVIVTCRPDDEDDFFSGDFLRVEVKGFSEQTIRNYFSVILGEDHKKVLCHLELFTLCHVPMYALMVAACFLSKTPEDSPQPCSMTEIYINIVRFCLQRSSNKTTRFLNSFIQEKKDKILSLAELAFHATKRKSVNLTDLPCEDSCVLCFLKPLVVKVTPTETRTTYAFLHYTVQEFFAALWLLKNPDQINGVFQQCLTEEGKHMKHLIPFMCGLLTEKSRGLLEHLVPAQESKSTSSWIFKEMISTFCPDVDLLFFCQCLYESQCPAACVDFLETLDYHLDLSAESLDSYLCCAVANVVTMSKERKVRLNLEDVSVSEQGITILIGCLDNVLWCDPLPQQMWRIVFLSEGQFNDASLLSYDGYQLNLPLQGRRELFERAAKILQKNPMKVNVCLHWDSRATTVCPSLSEFLLKALPCIRSLRMSNTGPGLQDKEERDRKLKETRNKLFLDSCLKAACDKEQSIQDVLQRLRSLFSVNNEQEFILNLYQHMESEGCLSVIPRLRLRTLFKSTPEDWFINLSEGKTSILLEVLKLQPEKKHVELRGWSYEESEVRTFLQCLPYISQLSFSDWSENNVKFCGRLFCAAAERDQQTGEKTLELLASLCTYQGFPLPNNEAVYQCGFLLDLYSYMKVYETETGLSVLPSLQSVFKSTPAVWTINLFEGKTSILLEVLKLQPEKKHVELRGWSYEESEVRTFLQCLPYISQLSIFKWSENDVKLCGRLFCAAAERDQQTGEKTLELLASLCTHQGFPSPNIEAVYQPLSCRDVTGSR
ncbi:nucleotide-binding oligomerization domain-containing protein 1-like [Halichoeres trimaculatus]|uniref:nucleotide-binding oligomerization domain-containing protein 1-like n=1 Tax=Halichoeres trimaculatus TaxID=147232 RepID=UPI003D9E5C56